MIKIDVAIPVRNEAGMIAGTLRSLQRQALDGRYHFNVTVIPNNCTDRTSEIAADTVAHFAPRPEISFCILNTDRPGKIAAINMALKRSSTKYFMYIDGDSILSSDCLTRVADTLRKPGVIVSGANAVKIIVHGSDPLVASFHRVRELVNEAIGHVRPPIGSMLAFRRDLLDEIPLTAIAEDRYVTLLAVSHYGCDAVETAADAYVYGIGTQTMDDYMQRSLRIIAVNQSLLANFPDLRTADAKLKAMRRPLTQHEIEARALPLLQAEGMGLEDLRLYCRTQQEMGQRPTFLQEHLQADGTWKVVESTKRILKSSSAAQRLADQLGVTVGASDSTDAILATILKLYDDGHAMRRSIQERYHVVRRSIASNLLGSALQQADAPMGPVLEIGGGPKSMLDNADLHGRLAITADIARCVLVSGRTKKGMSIRLDATKPLPFNDMSMSAIIAGEFIEHPYNVKDVFDEFYRILQPGGVLVLTTPNLAALQDRLRFLLGKSPRHTNALHPYLYAHIRPFTASSLAKILQATGFKQTTLTSNFLGWELPSGRWIQLRRPAKVFPKLGGTLIVLARKE